MVDEYMNHSFIQYFASPDKGEKVSEAGKGLTNVGTSQKRWYSKFVEGIIKFTVLSATLIPMEPIQL